MPKTNAGGPQPVSVSPASAPLSTPVQQTSSLTSSDFTDEDEVCDSDGNVVGMEADDEQNAERPAVAVIPVDEGGLMVEALERRLGASEQLAPNGTTRFDTELAARLVVEGETLRPPLKVVRCDKRKKRGKPHYFRYTKYTCSVEECPFQVKLRYLQRHKLWKADYLVDHSCTL
jgi:hypothetical protein